MAKKAKKKNPIQISFGYRVAELRKQQNLSQEQLGEKADLHRTYIGMIERAERNITLANIHKICRALQISISEFFKGLDR